MLAELFAKANRLTLMWAFPFGAGFALFGADLIVFVLGDEWRGAIVLLGGLAVAVALQQVGYSWFAFYRARGESWPQAVESVVFGASFVVLAVPGALLWDSWGFVVGRRAAARCACWPCAPSTCGGCCPTCGCRRWPRGRRCRSRWPRRRSWRCGFALWGGERTLWQALLELALWLGGLAIATRRLEGGLLAELRGYLGAPA